jgi:tRNA threonylcarbamoyladenosine biosynthesis protein TsaB
VFTALYDKSLNIILPEQALILNESSFYTHLEKNQIIFTGNCCIKWKEICKHSNALWIDVSNMLQNISKIAYFRKNQPNFAPSIKSAPTYLKGVYIEKKK